MRPRLAQLHRSGATSGQAVVWDGTKWAPAALTDAGAIPKTLLDAKGDLIVASAADTPARLAVGSDGWVLTADSTQATGVTWAASASGFSDPTTTKGDLIVHGTSTTRLPVGTNGQVLTADSTTAEGVRWGAAGGGSALPAKGVRVRQTTVQTLANATWTQITMTTEDEDAGSEWASSQWTCPLSGVYAVTGTIAFAANTSGGRWARLEKNAAVVDGYVANCIPVTGGNLTVVNFGWQIRVVTNDVLRLMAFQDRGGTLDTFSSSPYMSSMQIILVAT